MKVWHIIYVYQGDSPLKARQDLFFQSLERADTTDVQMVGGVSSPWSHPGWRTYGLDRDSTQLGDTRRKPYIKDLFGLVAGEAEPHDWLFFTNGDCSVVPDLYTELLSMKATAVEYQRLDVEDDPASIEELFSNPHSPYLPGIDGLALRAGFFQKYKDCLPDFIIGEPWWDPAYSWILRELVPVRRLEGRLYHPKHDQLWNVADPGPAGAHNYELMKRALELGHVKELSLFSRTERTDTAVITSLFGSCPKRTGAALQGLERQLQQDLYCDHFVVELLEEKQESRIPNQLRAQVHHLPIYGEARNAGLFQKEALFNIGWKTALHRQQYRYFIFTDGDIYSQERSWFRQIREKLRDQPSALVHGYRIVQDSLDPEFSFSSLGSVHSSDFQTDLPINPGLCWGIHRKMLEMGEGFNPYCIECAGDSALVTEYLNHPGCEYDTSLLEWPWYGEIQRELPWRAELEAVPVDIVHCHHGPASLRNYQAVRAALSKMGPLKNSVTLDSKGLLAWINPSAPQCQVLERREELTSLEEVDRILTEFGLSTDMPQPSCKAAVNRPVPEWPTERPALLDNLHSSTVQSVLSQGAYPVFNPTKVFRRAYSASWCDNVKKVDDTDQIPLTQRDGVCRLQLLGLENVSYIIGLAALQPNWVPVDVSDYESLSLSVYCEGDVGDVVIQLVSQDQDEQEHDSALVKLFERGLKIGEECFFTLNIDQFFGPDQFQIERVRTVKLLGYGSFLLEASKIVFERPTAEEV